MRVTCQPVTIPCTTSYTRFGSSLTILANASLRSLRRTNKSLSMSVWSRFVVGCPSSNTTRTSRPNGESRCGCWPTLRLATTTRLTCIPGRMLTLTLCRILARSAEWCWSSPSRSSARGTPSSSTASTRARTYCTGFDELTCQVVAQPWQIAVDFRSNSSQLAEASRGSKTGCNVRRPAFWRHVGATRETYISCQTTWSPKLTTLSSSATTRSAIASTCRVHPLWLSITATWEQSTSMIRCVDLTKRYAHTSGMCGSIASVSRGHSSMHLLSRRNSGPTDERETSGNSPSKSSTSWLVTVASVVWNEVGHRQLSLCPVASHSRATFLWKAKVSTTYVLCAPRSTTATKGQIRPQHMRRIPTRRWRRRSSVMAAQATCAWRRTQPAGRIGTPSWSTGTDQCERTWSRMHVNAACIHTSIHTYECFITIHW